MLQLKQIVSDGSFRGSSLVIASLRLVTSSTTMLARLLRVVYDF